MKRFFKTYNFCNHYNNKFILLLEKGVCCYEYIDDWKKVIEASLPEKKDFYSHLNVEEIIDADYRNKKFRQIP